MGVPALFRWLQTKYPKIIEHVIESPNNENDKDLLAPNPNGMEFDNLYLDMNGIIHPCCHPDDSPPPSGEEEMLQNIYDYIDHIFSLIRPRRLLFLAADGVAPRAKMNQQRSRRFRAAQEMKMKKLAEEERQREEDNENTTSPPSISSFDYNCITPGTPFMDLVMNGLKYYITDRISTNAAWQHIKVILSDSSVPGEGEHKIMDYIRKQRLDPQHDPNIKHVIYGLDADLIMLSLATHEPHFKVLREDVFHEEKFKRKRGNGRERGKEEENESTTVTGGNNGGENDKKNKKRKDNTNNHEKKDSFSMKPFIFLNILTLRDYLSSELKIENSKRVKSNLERAIDDWIFLCFFVGNDFLPHIPCLELREGAVDILIEIYKNNIDRMGGYICKDGKVNLRRAQIILDELGKIENIIFRKRREKEERFQERLLLNSSASSCTATSVTNGSNDNSTLNASIFSCINNNIESSNQTIKKKRKANEEENKNENEENDKMTNKDNNSITATATFKEKEEKMNESDIINDEDQVRLWEDDGKSRYYDLKLKTLQNDNNAMNSLIKSYLKGLCWVMIYYFQGCPSWSWFYPYHYAPMASDFHLVSHYRDDSGDDDQEENICDDGNNNDITTFNLGEPFLPFEQLMSVFPAASKNHIPSSFHHLMTNSESELLDFYPESFKVDLNGKRQIWQGVVLLPFIDETKLLSAVKSIYPKLSKEEMKLNQIGDNFVYFHSSMTNPKWIEEFQENRTTSLGNMNGLTGTIGLLRKGERGKIVENSESLLLFSHSPPSPPFESWKKLSEETGKIVHSFIYHMPFYERSGLKHRSNLLFGVKLPPSKLNDDDRYYVESGRASKSFRTRLDIIPNIYKASFVHHHHQPQHHSHHHHYNSNYRDLGRIYNHRNEQETIDPASRYPPPINTDMAMNDNGYSLDRDNSHQKSPFPSSLNHLEKKYKYPYRAQYR